MSESEELVMPRVEYEDDEHDLNWLHRHRFGTQSTTKSLQKVDSYRGMVFLLGGWVTTTIGQLRSPRNFD